MTTTYLKKTWTHIILTGGLLGMMAAAAHGESFSVEVPFAFEAAGKNFPAGIYTVDSISSGILVIRSTRAVDTAAMMVSPSERTAGPRSSLIFNKSSDLAVLSTVNLTSGLTLTVPPAKRLTATLTLLTHP